eukprot:COSAG01_NODE_2137_length_8329_cov_52.487242_9_plen_47_part_00
MRRGYYAAIGYMDYHFGLVLEALEETKAAKDTCVRDPACDALRCLP